MAYSSELVGTVTADTYRKARASLTAAGYVADFNSPIWTHPNGSQVFLDMNSVIDIATGKWGAYMTDPR